MKVSSKILSFLFFAGISTASFIGSAPAQIPSTVSGINSQTLIPSTSYEMVWQHPLTEMTGIATYHAEKLFQIHGQNLVALDLNTRHEVWNSDLGVHFPAVPGPVPAQYGRLETTTLTATDTLVMLGATRGASSHLLAFDARTGSLQWDFDAGASLSGKSDTHGKILSPPTVWHDRVIFRTGRGLTALRLTDGIAIWNVPFDASFKVPMMPNSFVVADERRVYFNSDFGVAYAFDPRTGSPIWSTQTHGMDIKGVMNMRQMHITYSNCQPLLVQNSLFVADGIGNIYALNTKNGDLIWTAHPGYTFQFASNGSNVYAATHNGLFEYDVNTGKSLRQYETPQSIFRCRLVNGNAILTHFPSGWEVFDLKAWKTISSDPDFAAGVNINVAGNLLILGGQEKKNIGTEQTELRAYDLSQIK